MAPPEKDKTSPENAEPTRAGIGEATSARKTTDQKMKKGNAAEKGEEDEEEDDYLPTPPDGAGNNAQKDTQKSQGGEQSEAESNLASEQSKNTPRTEPTEQSEMGKALHRQNRRRRAKKKHQISHMGDEEETQQKKSRSEYTPIRRSSQESIRHQQHLIIPEAGNNRPKTPTITYVGSIISISNQSEKSVVRAIEVPRGSATRATRTSEEQHDETMASEKRDRPPSPETTKGESPEKEREKE